MDTHTRTCADDTVPERGQRATPGGSFAGHGGSSVVQACAMAFVGATSCSTPAATRARVVLVLRSRGGCGWLLADIDKVLRVMSEERSCYGLRSLRSAATIA